MFFVDFINGYAVATAYDDLNDSANSLAFISEFRDTGIFKLGQSRAYKSDTDKIINSFQFTNNSINS